MRVSKRYYVRYEDNHIVCGSNEHNYSCASTLNIAKAIAYKIKKEIPNSRNIRVYDIEQSDEKGYAKIVYKIN